MTEKEAEDVIVLLRDTLANGLTQVIVDASVPGVEVPLRHMANAGLVLNLSWRYKGSNMHFGIEAFHVTLTFEGVEFRCVLPWGCFRAIAPYIQKETPADKRAKFKVVE